MIVCVNVDEAGRVAGGWGRARRVALATVTGRAIVSWQEIDVRWDLAHDEGGEGSHHARIVRFLRERSVDVAVTGHMGPPMQKVLANLGVRVVLGSSGDARSAALAAVS
jgi:predicted Fe-Mo cluster-binding NifX family protein